MKNRNLFKAVILTVLVAMLFAFSACALIDSGNKPDSSSQESESSATRNYVLNGEIFIFENGVRMTVDENFVNIDDKIYYAKANRAVTGLFVLGSKLYEFDDEGALDESKVYDKQFVEVGGKTYYVEQNRVAFGLTVIDGAVYDFGDDGNYIKDTYFDCEFVDIDGYTYYVIDNKIVRNIFILDKTIYDFGNDGKLDKTRVFDKELVDYDGNTYYAEKNKVVFTIKVENGEVCVYDNDGNVAKLAIDKAFVMSDGKKYYVVSDKIVKNTYFIVNSTVYFADSDGIVPDKIFDKMFFETDGNTYYAIEGKIAVGINIIDGKAYLFDDDGVLTDKVFDKVFFNIGDKTYYAVNGTVITGNHVIDDKAYLFDETGVLTDKVFDKEFFDVGEITYYAVEGTIVKNVIKIIDDGIYEFGIDGALNKDKVFETGFTVVDEKTYYVVEGNKILSGVRVIDKTVYDFGDDGVLIPDAVFDNTFVTAGDDVYYAIENKVVTGYKFIVEHIYIFDEDGKLLRNTGYETYTVSENGTITAPKDETIFVEVDLIRYIVASDYAAPARSISGTIVASDTETTYTPAEALKEVQLKIVFGGITFETLSDENGCYALTDIPETTLSVALNGYVDADIELSGKEDNLDIVMDKNVSIDLLGTVYVSDDDFNYNNNKTVSGAKLTLERISSTNILKNETETDDYGGYIFTDLTAGVYRLVAEAEGYMPITQTLTIHSYEVTAYNVALEMFAISDTDETGSASGTITDGKTGNPVTGIRIDVYDGITNTSGEVITTVYTDEDGNYLLEDLNQGNYTLKITDSDAKSKFDRYHDCVLQIKVVSGKLSSRQDASIVKVSELSADTVRITLGWGATPADLDSHLVYGKSNHVYYGSKNELGANLDKDVVSGYGIETIIVSAPLSDETYTYYVQNFSNEKSLSMSAAVVRVYIGYDVSATYTFYVPAEEVGINEDYNMWNVFSFVGLEKTITFIDTTEKTEITDDKN